MKKCACCVCLRVEIAPETIRLAVQHGISHISQGHHEHTQRVDQDQTAALSLKFLQRCLLYLSNSYFGKPFSARQRD